MPCAGGRGAARRPEVPRGSPGASQLAPISSEVRRKESVTNNKLPPFTKACSPEHGGAGFRLLPGSLAPTPLALMCSPRNSAAPHTRDRTPGVHGYRQCSGLEAARAFV